MSKPLVIALIASVVSFSFTMPVVVAEPSTGCIVPLQAEPLAALARMPVREVTVFKDGHAFVLHEGGLPTDPAGNVMMDYLPTPVLGTFWPFSANKDVKLSGVVAAQRRVLIEQTALSLAELLEANSGAEAIITEKAAGASREPVSYAGTILGIPRRSPEELAATGRPNAGERMPEKGSVILIRTNDGVKVVNVESIQDVTFKAPHKSKLSHEEFRNLLTLKLDWGNRTPDKTANVGLVYLQKGLRWIPGYNVTIDGKGNAVVRLQATLLNELTDLLDVTVNLVIGVPAFAFKDTLDPVALQQAALSPYFQADRSPIATNVLVTQVARMSEPREAAPPSLGPELPESTRSEDLFVFTVRRLSLKKGERIVLPVAEVSLPYRDVFTLDLPFAPPPEARVNLNNEQQVELARLLNAPKVAHKIRLTNKSSYPLTTAPALIIRDNRVLAQGTMTYTSIGGSTDLEITKAVDIQVLKSESETSRTPNAIKWQGYDYGRVDLSGTIKLTNYRSEPVELEITRHVLGNVTAADHDGVVTKANVFEDYNEWWRSYGWPDWWTRINGVGRLTWKLRLEAGKSVELGYNWHYFWR